MSGRRNVEVYDLRNESFPGELAGRAGEVDLTCAVFNVEKDCNSTNILNIVRTLLGRRDVTGGRYVPRLLTGRNISSKKNVHRNWFHRDIWKEVENRDRNVH